MKKTTNVLLTLILALIVQLSFGQEKEITGIISDESGLPLPGVNIVIKNTTKGTQTDFDGKYAIQAKQGDILQFSYVSYESAEKTVGASNTISFSLNPSVEAIDEVVVVGYGTKAKRATTGSITTIKSEQIENAPAANFAESLQGKSTGLQSISASGQPGAKSNVRIRGTASVNGNSSPLYVIDGVPINNSNTDLGQGGLDSSTRDPLSNLNASDIESVTILKDASSTSIYGARAANGIIMITTKRGKSGEAKFDFSSQTGFSARAVNNFKVLRKDEYNDLMREAEVNAGADPSIAYANYPNTDVETNWGKLAYRDWNAMTQRNNFSVSGGTESGRYYISVGHLNQEGIAVGSGLERLSSKISLQANATKKVKIGMDISYSNTRQNTALAESAYFASPVVATYLFTPTMKPYNDDGTPNYDNPATGGTTFLGSMAYDSEKNVINRIIGNIFTDIDVYKNTSFRSKFGVDRSVMNFYSYGSPLNYGNPAGGSAQRLNNSINIWNWTNTLKWANSYENHNLDFMLGHEANYEEQDMMNFNVEDFPSLLLTNVGAAANVTNHSSLDENASLLSFFANMGYDFDKRYHLNATVRRDASSRFGPNNKWGTFWSTGANWLVSEEKFLANSKWLNKLKLQLSYGVQGNTTVDRYPWQGTYLNDSYNDKPTSLPDIRKENPDLKWETQKMLDAGIELAALSNRLNLGVNYFDRRTSDLFFKSPIPASSGYTEIFQNAGSFKNSGFEFDLGYDIISKDKFRWNVFGNLTLLDTKVTELDETTQGEDRFYIREVGEAWNTFYLRKWAGVDPATGNPMWYDKDGNVTFTYSAAERQKVGKADPDFYGGFGTSFEYMNFTLSGSFSYQFGNKIYNATSRITNSDGAFHGFNQSREQLDRWEKPGDLAPNPKRIQGNPSQSNQASTRWLEDGSFIRMKDITLSYTLPSKLSKSVKLNSLKIFTQGTNLFTWTKFNGDPEQALNGEHWFVYPNAKTVTLGLNVSF